MQEPIPAVGTHFHCRKTEGMFAVYSDPDSAVSWRNPGPRENNKAHLEIKSFAAQLSNVYMILHIIELLLHRLIHI